MISRYAAPDPIGSPDRAAGLAGLELQSQTITVDRLVFRSVEQFFGLGPGQVGALRLQMSRDNRFGRANGDISPRVPADERECVVAEFDLQALAEIGAAAALDPDSGVASNQDHIAVRQAHILGRARGSCERIAGERGRLDIGLLLYVDDLIADAAAARSASKMARKS